MASSRLIVRREPSLLGVWSKFKVLADYEEIGLLKPDSLLDVELPSGNCDIQIQVRSSYSEVLTIELLPNHTAHVNCRSKRLPLFLKIASGVFGVLIMYSPLFFTLLCVACLVAVFKVEGNPIELKSPQAVD